MTANSIQTATPSDNPLFSFEPNSVRIVLDSVSDHNIRLTTFEAVIGKPYLGEIARHRKFSIAASSSRAIPAVRTLDYIRAFPLKPLRWGKNKRGMDDGGVELPKEIARICESRLEIHLQEVLDFCEFLARNNAHKQILNRYLEPFLYVPIALQSTDWENFFFLRCADDVQPETALIADKMLELYVENTPKYLPAGSWHLPYMDKHVLPDISLEHSIMVCAARCARTSYANMNGEFSLDKDLQLYQDLKYSGHFSPLEFPAYATSDSHFYANLQGWNSHRNTLPVKTRQGCLKALLAERRKKNHENQLEPLA